MFSEAIQVDLLLIWTNVQFFSVCFLRRCDLIRFFSERKQTQRNNLIWTQQIYVEMVCFGKICAAEIFFEEICFEKICFENICWKSICYEETCFVQACLKTEEIDCEEIYKVFQRSLECDLLLCVFFKEKKRSSLSLFLYLSCATFPQKIIRNKNHIQALIYRTENRNQRRCAMVVFITIDARYRLCISKLVHQKSMVPCENRLFSVSQAWKPFHLVLGCESVCDSSHFIATFGTLLLFFARQSAIARYIDLGCDDWDRAVKCRFTSKLVVYLLNAQCPYQMRNAQ